MVRVDSTTTVIGRLHLASGTMSRRVFELTQDRVNVGREDDNLIRLDHITVSLHHAVLIRTGSHYKVRDLISTNGTFINGVRITGEDLRHGDTLLFGEVEMWYEEPGQPPAEPKIYSPQTALPLGRSRPIEPPAKELEYRIVGADGRTYGPVNATQLQKWISQGFANEQTWVPAEARRNWKQLAEFPEFADALRANPTATNLLGTPPKEARSEAPVKVTPIAAPGLVTATEPATAAEEAPVAPTRWGNWPHRVAGLLLVVLVGGAGAWWFERWPFGSGGPLRQFGRSADVYVLSDPDYAVAGAAEDAKNYTELLKTAKVLADRYPNSGVVQYILGEAYAKLGFFSNAATAFQEAIKLKPDYVDAWYNLGWAYTRAGNMPEAADVFQQLVKLTPRDPQAWENLGGAYAGEGHPADAIAAYRKAVELKPDFADAHFKLGAAYASQGRYPEAINAYRLALKHRPDFPEAWFNLGVVSEQQGDHDEAVLFFQQALKLKPNYAEAWGGLVRAYLKLHQTGKAGDAAREMKKIDPVKADQLAQELSRETPQPLSTPARPR
ncbi:MAG TPA: tetratricopeptide repeat protein [Verrucomicrobiae bacterium]|nr:tetratricopeptide repeat protein [Verrucomicrobiae bacterium]